MDAAPKTAATERVLVIGLDGATWNVLEPWMSDGSLPNLSGLRRQGSWGYLLSTVPPLSAPAWSTFMTGKGPGKHGVFHFVDVFDQDGTAQDTVKPLDARDIRSSTLWDILGHHGRKLVAINVTMTYPPRQVYGSLISGLLTPPNAPVFTYPSELAQELPGYMIDLDRLIHRKPFQEKDFDPLIAFPKPSLVQEFRDLLENRTRASLSLMKSKPWSLFVVVYTGTDRMGHYLWPYHRTPDAHEPTEVQALCHAVHDYYVRLDAVAGELVEAAGPRATTILLSDHGMGPPSTKRIRLNHWLQQEGYLSVTREGRGATNLNSWLRRLRLTREEAGKLVRRIPGLSKSGAVVRAANRRYAAVDIPRSMAYGEKLEPQPYLTGIRINPDVQDRKALRDQIMEGLLTILDPDTGECPVRWVYRAEELYPGPYSMNVPDIVAIADSRYAWAYAVGPYASIITPRPQQRSVAAHQPEGILVVTGPGVVSHRDALADLGIVDVAPTILYLLDLPVPSDMDGRVLTDLFMPDRLSSRPIRFGDPIGYWPDEHNAVFLGDQTSDEDYEHMRSRLRALGYLD